MSRSFSPRRLDTDAWKGWHKDALRLMGRTGVVVVALWGLCVVGLAFLLNRLTGNSAVYLLALLGMQFAGVFTQPLIQRCLDQVAEGHRLNVGQALTETGHEISRSWGWFRRRLVGQVIAALVLLTITVLVVVLASNDASDKTTASDPLNPVVQLVIHLAMVPAILRNHGLMDFDYWLRGRHGIEPAVANALFMEARSKNSPSMLVSVLGFVALFLASSHVALVGLVALPLIQWYHAAYTRCAYHDIFEDGTGLKAPVAQTSTDASLVPVLQA